MTAETSDDTDNAGLELGIAVELTLVLYKISSSEEYRAVYKALHGIFTGLSLVILSEIQKK